MREPLMTYGLVVGLSGIAFLMQLYLGFLLGRETVFLLYFPVILISAWRGGFKPGIAATILASLSIAFFLIQQPLSNISPIIQLYIFFLEGVLVSFFIDKLTKTEIVSVFKKKEKERTDIIARLEKKNALAQEEIRARDEFLSIASHELKTPLTSMLLQMRTALNSIHNVSLANFSVEKLLKMLESVERQTNRLSKMINDLLNVSLITTKKMDLEFEQFDIAELTKQVTDSFSERLKRDGYEISLDIDQPVIGRWDKVRIEQAMTNLLSNAIKYGDKKPIAITLKNHDETVKISVRDHGIGIPASQREKIFALFERGALSSKYKGLGVGLFITDQIVKAHHGKIDVKSKEHKGSAFTMELPLKPSHSIPNAN